MCQAIVKPAEAIITKRELRRAWTDNPDGAGLAWRDENDHVITAKGYFTFKQLWRAYRQVSDRDVLIHLRYATHGAKDATNCHPFEIGDDAVLAHNGIMYRFAPPVKTDVRSDTKYFVDECILPALKLAQMSPYAFFTHPATQALLAQVIDYSKLALLFSEGFVILNENLGEWKNGVWWSAGYPEDRKSCYGVGGYEHWKHWEYEDETVRGYCEATATRYLDRSSETGGNVVTLFRTCFICQKSARVLYQIGADDICVECWDGYAG